MCAAHGPRPPTGRPCGSMAAWFGPSLEPPWGSGVTPALLLVRVGGLREGGPMATGFRRGDHVEWNSEAGRVRGTIQKKVTSEIVFKGYKRHATPEEPQYIIKSDKTDHLAIHK